MFTFTSLLGAQSPSTAAQSILELEGGIKVLVDVGWDESFDPSLLDALERQVESLSFILLTHATTAHLAAYAHCCKHFPSFTSIPVYATPPVKSLGRALLQDVYLSNPLAASFISRNIVQELAEVANINIIQQSSSQFLLQPPSSSEIISYFNAIHILEYSQPHQPEVSPSSPPLNDLTITAFSAGHSLGGSLWHINQGLESIVYAVDWNQSTDSIFRPAAWLGAGGGDTILKTLNRPSALICSSRASQRTVTAGGVQAKISQLVASIKETILLGGSILIPADSCAKALEISYFLEQAWENDMSLRKTNLYFVSPSASLILKHAQKLTEFVNPVIAGSLDAYRDNRGNKKSNNDEDDEHNEDNANEPDPFSLKFVKLIEHRKQLDKILALDSAKVIVASDLSLEWGHARACFDLLSQDFKNLVVLLEPSNQMVLDRPSVAATLWAAFSDSSNKNNNGIFDPHGKLLTVFEPIIDPLEGDDLLIYQQHLARERESKLTTDTANNLQESFLDDDASSTTSSGADSDDEGKQGKALNLSNILKQARPKADLSDEELGVNILVAKKGVFDWVVGGQKGHDKLFPVPASHKLPRNDDYGEIIRYEDYMRLDERETKEVIVNEKDVTDKKIKWAESIATTAVEEIEIDEARPPDGPAKATFERKMIPLHARISYVDFSGMHDKASIGRLISLLNPQKLLLTGGSASETKALEEDCKKILNSMGNAIKIYTPVMGETVNASLDTNAWNVKLSIPLQGYLKFQKVGSLGIVPLSGHLKMEEYEPDESQAKKARIDDNSVNRERNKVPILDVVPRASSASTSMSIKPLHVGDLGLADFRKAMNAEGFAAEWLGDGTLIVNDNVAVRKSAVGKIELETVICMEGSDVLDKTFDEVRKRIYGRLALISGIGVWPTISD